MVQIPLTRGWERETGGVARTLSGLPHQMHLLRSNADGLSLTGVSSKRIASGAFGDLKGRKPHFIMD